MTIKSTVLFGSPRGEIASILTSKLRESVFTQIVAGFATENGLRAIEAPILERPEALDAFVIGAGTQSAFGALDRLLEAGVRKDALRVHLGHVMNTGTKERKRDRFRPMLHSKVYYMEHADGTASAVIGSHNVTGFALLGMNGEAAVLLEGDRSSAEFEKIRSHIKIAKEEASEYSSDQKEALAWWTRQFFIGLNARLNSGLRESEKKKTIVILCEQKARVARLKGILYFELSDELDSLNSLSADIHLYVFPVLPSTPQQALEKLDQAQGFRCTMVALDVAQGSKEIKADWLVDGSRNSTLQKAPSPFRPSTNRGMQQVCVEIGKPIRKKSYQYLFDEDDWIAVTDPNCVARVPRKFIKDQPSGCDGPAREKSWFLVKSFEKINAVGQDKKSIALKKMSPEAGVYLVMSLRRRRLDAAVDGE